MTSLIVLFGPPAAGKTTFARTLADVVHIEFDALAGERGGVAVGATVASSLSTWDYAKALASDALRHGHPAVFDYLAVQPAFRQELRDLADHAGVPAHLVIIDAPIATCLARNDARNGQRLSLGMLRHLYRLYLAERERAAAEPWATVATHPASCEHTFALIESAPHAPLAHRSPARDQLDLCVS